MSQEEMDQCWKRLAEKMEEEVVDKYKVDDSKSREEQSQRQENQRIATATRRSTRRTQHRGKLQPASHRCPAGAIRASRGDTS